MFSKSFKFNFNERNLYYEGTTNDDYQFQLRCGGKTRICNYLFIFINLIQILIFDLQEGSFKKETRVMCGARKVPHNSVGIMTTCQSNRICQVISLFLGVKTSNRTHSASYPLSIGIPFSGDKEAGVPRLRTYVAIPPFPSLFL